MNRGDRSSSGYVMVALVAAMAVMLVGLGAAAPTWTYLMKDMREEELIFRGSQIADAIQRFQKKHGNAPPTSLDQLVQGRFLRQAYTDPMTKDGQWRLVRQGELVGLGGPGRPGQGGPGGSGGPGRPGGSGGPGGSGFGSGASGGFGAGARPSPSPEASPSGSPSSFEGPRGGPGVSTGQSFGGLVGVASKSKDKSLRIFNGKTTYDEWIFAVGLPRVVGKPPQGALGRGGPFGGGRSDRDRPGGNPNPGPNPSPRTP